jgi:hypothetical protein
MRNFGEWVDALGEWVDALKVCFDLFRPFAARIKSGVSCSKAGGSDVTPAASLVPPLSLATGQGDHAQHGGGGTYTRRACDRPFHRRSLSLGRP